MDIYHQLARLYGGVDHEGGLTTLIHKKLAAFSFILLLMNMTSEIIAPTISNSPETFPISDSCYDDKSISHVLLGDAWCGKTPLITFIHYLSLSAMTAGFGRSPGTFAYNNAFYRLVSPLLLLYLLLICVMVYCVIASGLAAVLLLLSTFLTLNIRGVAGYDSSSFGTSMSLLAVLVISISVSCWFFITGDVSNGSSEGALLLLIPLLVSLSGRLYIQSATTELSAANWDASEDGDETLSENYFSFPTVVSNLDVIISSLSSKEIAPKGTSKMIALLTLIFSSAGLVDIPHLFLLIISWFIFLQRKTSKASWKFLVIITEFMITSTYTVSWVVPKYSNEFENVPHPVFGDASPESLALLTLALCFAIGHWKSLETPEWWRNPHEPKLLSETMLTGISLGMLLVSSLQPDNTQLLTVSGLLLYTIGGWIIGGAKQQQYRRGFTLWAGIMTGLLTLAIFIGRFQGCSVCSRVGDWVGISAKSRKDSMFTWHLPIHEISWLCTSLVLTFQLNRYKSSFIESPAVAPYIFSTIIAPACLLLAALCPPSYYTVIGLSYFLLAVATVLSRFSLLFYSLSGHIAPNVASGGMSVLDLSAFVALLFIVHVVCLPSLSSWMRVPLSDAYSQWVSGVQPKSPLASYTVADLVPHCLVLTGSFLERWCWLHTKSKLFKSKTQPDFQLSVSFEILLGTLMIGVLQESTLFSIVYVLIAITLARLGKVRIAQRPSVPLAVLVVSVIMGLYSYIVSTSVNSRIDLVLNFLVTSAAGATATASFQVCSKCYAQLYQIFDERITSELLTKQDIINQSRRNKSDMTMVIPIEIKSSKLILKSAVIIPYILLIIVFIHGSYQQADGSTYEQLQFTQVAKILFSVVMLPRLDSSVWKGNHDWKWGARLYAGLAITWLVGDVIPELTEKYPSVGFKNQSLTSILIIGSLLWRWGRVMDSLFWMEVLRTFHDDHQGSKAEGTRIATERRDSVEESHEITAHQRELRKDALREIQKRKKDVHKAWNKLMKLGADTPGGINRTPTMLPIPSQSKMTKESPSLSEFDFLPIETKVTSTIGQLPTGVVYPPSFSAKLLSYVLFVSYRPLSSLVIEKDYIQQIGLFSSYVHILLLTLCSVGAEVIYLVTTLHFLANPCIATLLPFLTVLLYALVSCPMPVSAYWKYLVIYYQVLIVIKAIVLSLVITKVNSNSILLLTLGWKTILQADAGLSFFQFIAWEATLLLLLLLHRYSLDNIFGLWSDIGVCLERLIPVKTHIDNQSIPSHYTSRSLSMWGGVRYGNTVLGGASVQTASQSTAKGIIPGLDGSYRRFWINLFNTTVKPGADYYIFAFVFDLTSWVVLLAGFSAIMGSNVGIAESIKNNLLPGSLVLVLFVLFTIMVVDRIVYLTRSLHTKVIFHVLLTLLYLMMYLGWCYSHIERFGALKTQGTDASRWKQTAFRPTLVLQLFCGLKLAYLAVSALQLRSGFPDTIQMHFFAERYSTPWYLLYSVYRAVPFLFEFRSILDWTFSSTSLKLAYWLRLEDITHEIHICSCDRYDTTKLIEKTGGEGKAYPKSWKCRSGAGFILALSSILFFPLLWYSSIGPALTVNYVTEAEISLSLSSKESALGDLFYAKYEIPKLDGLLEDLQNRHQSLSLPPAWGQSIESTRPSLAGFGLAYGGTRTLQMLPFSKSSLTRWELSGAAVSELLETSSRALLNQTDLYCGLNLRIKRPYAPKNTLKISEQQSHKFEPRELKELVNIVSTGSGSLVLPLLYTPFAFSRSEELKFFEIGPTDEYDIRPQATNRVNCLLTLHNEQNSYWTMECSTLFANGNPSAIVNADGTSGFKFTNREAACINATIYEELAACADINYDLDNSVPQTTQSGPYFLAISDLVTNGSMLIPSLGVIALYTTFVLAVGRVLRASLTGDASKLHLTNMETPDSLRTLIGYIHMARAEGDLELEHGLFYELVSLLKNQEVMRQWLEVQSSVPTALI